MGSDFEDSAVAEQRRRLNRLNAEEVRLRAMESQIRYQQRRLQLQQQETEHVLNSLASPAKSPARPSMKSTPLTQTPSRSSAAAQPKTDEENEQLSMPEHERRVAWYNHQMQLYKRQMHAHEHAIHELKSQEEALSDLLENADENNDQDEGQYQQLLDLYAKLQEQQSRQQQLEEQQRLLSELQIELQTASQLQQQRQIMQQAEKQASEAAFNVSTPRDELPPRPASATPKRAMRQLQQQ